MATVVLQVAGTAIGGAIGGPIGAAVGRAVGAAAGYLIDRELFGPGDRAIEGPRLNSAGFLSSEEGAPVPKVYGRTRLSGQIIWATRFEEVQETESQGGKGGPKTHVTSYSYFANLAIGLCEGEIACIRRVWADGKLLDQSDLTIRLHKGGEDQLPDSLIEARQGSGNAPAYRGIAYLVFEHLPLADFGNRIPQIAVEVIRPVGHLEKRIKAVALLPGASEFGYDPLPVSDKLDQLTNVDLNTNNTIAESDWSASMDELQALCPNLQSVALISSWFGNDLRAENCICQPRVEVTNRSLQSGEEWQVSGLPRNLATPVSQVEGKPAFGGTPSDGSIVRAIQDCHQRGLKVTFYPFLMMDIPASNTNPDPYGSTNQATYPWRGRITCHPAIGQPSSADKSASVNTQIDGFVGQAAIADFSNGENTIIYNGPQEWSYRRQVLHYAKLCALAGGVEAFLIGSELRGLTRLQDDTGAFPFVNQLRALAGDVRTILGPNTKISYAADWSEYFGYQPEDGSGDVHFNLDPLWADSNIDMVAIDNYMPLSDWREDGTPDGIGASPRDRAMFAANIAAEEGFDWYYLSDGDRKNGVRTPITDGLGKPWIFRYKDLKSWWSNEHRSRSNGVEAMSSTPWAPQMKPLWFTELGCPAIDKGANQPNVFVDPKSSESNFPYFSNGNRDDAVQASFIEAHQQHWDAGHPLFDGPNNPLSTAYAGRMVDVNNTHLWAWDVRPYPVFPENSNLWSDGGNWRLGHWLNGRLGAARLADVVAAILEDYGIEEFDVSQVYGFADGFVVPQLASARDALQSLIDLYQLQVLENGRTLIFSSSKQLPPIIISQKDFAENGDAPQKVVKRIQETDLPKSVVLEHFDPQIEFQPSATYSRRIEGRSERHVSLGAPLILPQELAVPLVDSWLRAAWIGRNSLQIRLPHRYLHLQVGDQVEFAETGLPGKWLITRIEEADALSLDLRTIETIEGSTAHCQMRNQFNGAPGRSAAPLSYLMDLPVLRGEDATRASRIAIASKPWLGPHNLFSSPDDESYIYRQSVDLCATLGALKTPLNAGATSRWDSANTFEVEIFKGTLSAQPELQILNGANVAAIQSKNGNWEVLQFQSADLIAPNIWRLSNLLRGQAGTEQETASGAAINAPFVLLNKAVEPLLIETFEIGLEINWKTAPPGGAVSDPGIQALSFKPGIRGFIPYSPVHLNVEIGSGQDVVISWIRRDRINADAWNDGEIAMSEESELYSATLKSGGTVVRQWQVTTNQIDYTRAEQLADISSFPVNLTIAVAQISATHGSGVPTMLNFTLT